MAITHKFVHSIHAIGEECWNQLIQTDNPFLQYSWLAALQDNHCIASENQQTEIEHSGWQAHYLLVEKDEKIVAIAPVFEKHHSYGEYIFDWAWADAYHRHGLDYYPKLVWAVPFTPSTGPRLISQAKSSEYNDLSRYCAEALTEFCQQYNFSGWHCLYPEDALKEAIKAQTLSRNSCQFHWYNLSLSGHRYQNFEHFLADFSSRKRKNVRKERKRFQSSDIEIKRLTGSHISQQDIENFYHCYQLTYLKRGMQGYLNLNFFQQLRQTMADQMLLVQANLISEDDNQACSGKKNIANALYFKDQKNLYGRYWGSLDEYHSLHFECCYYQGIEYCIENDLQHFDPGTQGEHKISRGFRPIICNSQHWIAHPQFRAAIKRFVEEEQQDIRHYQQQASEHLPFKKIDDE